MSPTMCKHDSMYTNTTHFILPRDGVKVPTAIPWISVIRSWRCYSKAPRRRIPHLIIPIRSARTSNKLGLTPRPGHRERPYTDHPQLPVTSYQLPVTSYGTRSILYDWGNVTCVTRYRYKSSGKLAFGHYHLLITPRCKVSESQRRGQRGGFHIPHDTLRTGQRLKGTPPCLPILSMGEWEHSTAHGDCQNQTSSGSRGNSMCLGVGEAIHKGSLRRMSRCVKVLDCLLNSGGGSEWYHSTPCGRTGEGCRKS